MDIHEEGVIRAEHETAFEVDLAVLQGALDGSVGGHGMDFTVCSRRSKDKGRGGFAISVLRFTISELETSSHEMPLYW